MSSRDDQNFHLLLLDHLLISERVTVDALADFVGAGVDIARLRELAVEEGVPGEEQAVRAVIARLARYPISDEDHEDIVDLAGDSSDEIYMFIEGLIGIDTEGEEDWYETVGSAAIRRCVNVERVRADCYFQGLDCGLLVGLTALEEVHLGLRWARAEALLQVPTLRRVFAGEPLPAELVAQLQARGVEVAVSAAQQ